MVREEKEIAKKLYSSYRHNEGEVSDEDLLSREYKIFEQKKTTADTLYEKLAQLSGKIIKIKVPPKRKKEVEEILSSSNLNVSAEDAKAISYFVPIMLAIFAIAFLPLSLMMTLAMFAFSAFGYFYFANYPKHLIEIRRTKSSTEIILAILYIVIYMKNVSNLEEAVRFAADNLEGPLARDLKKMLWDVSTKKYTTIKDAFDDYLIQWKKYNPPFVDSVYLIETSLVQKDEVRRINLLDQALKRILDGTYEMMVHYVNGLRTPISAVFMLGITLPIMGLVMLPIIGAFLANLITPSSLFVFYDLLLPLVVVIMILQILGSRPSAFPQINLEGHPLVPPKGKFYFFGMAIPIIIPVILTFIIFNIPFVVYLMSPRNPVPSEVDVIFSLFFVLALAFSIVVYAKLNTDIKVKIRKEIKGVEDDFAYAIFQISNRLEEGMPAEISILKTAVIMKNSHVAKFIGVIANNISKLGLSLKEAVFNKKYGAINLYPSSLIRSVMKIFIQSTKESEKVAATSLTHTAQYLQSVHRIEEKIKDVLSETLSSLKFQAAFIAPLISGIIVGLTAMILSILAVLGEKISGIGSSAAEGGVPSISGSLSFGFFEMSNTIPLAWFQIIVGIYLIEIVVISAVLASKIEYGDDSIQELYTVKKLLMYAIIIYFFVAAGVTVAFGSMARIAVSLGTFG